MGSTVPVRIRTTTTRSSVSQAARRHGRLIQGEAGHDYRSRARDQRGAGERGAGQPRALREVIRQRIRMPAAEQDQDPGRDPGRDARHGGQPEQQAEPAVAERDGDDQRRRGHARHLHEAGQDLAGRAESMPPTAAAGPSSHRDAASEATTEPSSRMPPAISRITSPGWRYREDGTQAVRGDGDRMPAHRRSAAGRIRHGRAGRTRPARPARPPAPLELVHHRPPPAARTTSRAAPRRWRPTASGPRGRPARPPSGSRSPPRPRPTPRGAVPGGTSAMTAATTVTEAAMACPEGNDAPLVATSDPGGLVRS